jgi:hypothetical protein
MDPVHNGYWLGICWSVGDACKYGHVAITSVVCKIAHSAVPWEVYCKKLTVTMPVSHKG